MRFDRRDVIGGLALAATGLPVRRAFASGGEAVVNHIALEDGRVWIAAKLDGKGPYFFIFDTGATSNFIDDSFAKSINLQKITGGKSVGMGGKVADYSAYIARELTLANGLRFPDMQFAGIGKRVSKDAVGALSAAFFTSYDSDLDFVKGEWRAYPKGRPTFDGLTKLPSRFTRENRSRRIEVEATVDGYSGDFLVDTGAPSISLTGRAAGDSGLWDDGRPFAPIRIGGVGDGFILGRLVRAKKVKVGPFVFEDMLVSLSKPGTISMKQEGILGLSALSRLDLSTDVSSGTLWCRPNGLGEPAGRYSLSGLWLDEVKGRLTVVDVGNGSAAAAAGVRTGDVVIAADLPAALRQINGPPGRQVVLKIERGGAQQEVRYTLKPWL